MLSFIKKFKETQIFCHYCQLEREKQTAMEIRNNTIDNGSMENSPRVDFTANSDVTEIVTDFPEDSRGPNGKLYVHTGSGPTDYKDGKTTTSVYKIELKESIIDPVASLFAIMINGSLPHSENDLNHLSNALDKLYSIVHQDDPFCAMESPVSFQAISGESYYNANQDNNVKTPGPSLNLNSHGSPAAHPSSWNPFVSPPPPMSQGMLKKNQKLTRYTEKMLADAMDGQSTTSKSTTSSEYNPFTTIREDALFCNGRCGGRMNTPMCTEICCQVVTG